MKSFLKFICIVLTLFLLTAAVISCDQPGKEEEQTEPTSDSAKNTAVPAESTGLPEETNPDSTETEKTESVSDGPIELPMVP